ncbi:MULTISPECIES: hypothetical protein [unclassified Pseudovibrio]|uniref:hypothetical protein n=1 Tax=unclassified Pseudovibrio TaxID=2627060 RepID=UPI0007AEA5DB|nr:MULTISPECIES: hypothetical protein [unclassified Pseudovibrio]KZL00426.1 hypothetical protein PsW74_02851 [Pseudovibrio sp. W74]KZL07426.1 hypothetical protein PsAD14_03811 [Pseudovibrio sp. Ad14]
MTDFILEIFYHLPFWKTAVIVAFALIGALLQEAGFWQRVLTFFIGIAAAVTFTQPLLDFFELKAAFSDATAGVLAMSGRNITAFVLRLSRDPFKSAGMILKIWKGYR